MSLYSTDILECKLSNICSHFIYSCAWKVFGINQE